MNNTLTDKSKTALMVIAAVVLTLGLFSAVFWDELKRPKASLPDHSFASIDSGKATILGLSGVVEYIDGSAWFPAVAGADLGNVKIRTGPDAHVDMRINGHASVIRLLPNSQVDILEMKFVGAGPKEDSATALDLQMGGIVGIVGPLTAQSRCEMRTAARWTFGLSPRDAEFSLTVGGEKDGRRGVSASDVAGEITAVSLPSTNIMLKAGERFDSSEEKVKPMKQGEMDNLKAILAQLKKEAGTSRSSTEFRRHL